MKRFLLLLFLLAALLSTPHDARAVTQQAGPYQVEVTTDPATIPVGKAQLEIKVSADGKAVEGAEVRAITGMPGMFMGEREQAAMPKPGEPGTYTVPTAFPMAGGYVSTITISGPQGPATAEVPLSTGANTRSGGGFAWPRLLMASAVFALIAFTVYRMWRTGQKPNYRAMFSRQVAGGVFLLAVMAAVSWWAVSKWRRPGAMTPIEAQAMKMEMPAPPGVLPVELAKVDSGAVANTVRYTGQAVGYVEQRVYPRVTGILEYMPLYAGDRIKQGQVLARLDTSQYDPQVAERRAAAGGAERDVDIAREESRQARAQAQEAEAEAGKFAGGVVEARSEAQEAQAEISRTREAVEEARSTARRTGAEVEARRGALSEARSQENKARQALREAQSGLRAARAGVNEAESNIEVAREEQSGSEAEVAAAETAITAAQAELRAELADLEYWRKEIARMEVLVREGAVSREEYQREEAQYVNAQAEVAQARARLNRSQAQLRAAQTRPRRAAAAIRGAQAKARQAEAGIAANEARIEQAQAEIGAAGARTRQAQAAVRAAQAETEAANARIAQAQAGVRAAQAEAESANSRIAQAISELQAHHAHVRGAESGAEAARERIGKARSGAQQARAALTSATTTRGYTTIRSEVNGVVTQRLISPGVLVQPGQAILEVAQINPIRLQANVAASDLPKIKVGAPVTVYARDTADKPVQAKVTSIAPSVDSSARTGVVEAVVDNPTARFLPGEFVSMSITTGQVFNSLRVPTRAIQRHAVPSGGTVSVDTLPFVWVAKPGGEDGQFTVERRDVQLGLSSGEFTAMEGGLNKGDRVVVRGYQSLKSGMAVSAAGEVSDKPDRPAAANGTQTASVVITEEGYVPARIALKAGVPALVTFTRKTDATCGTEIVIPEYSINEKLPLGKPVTVQFTPDKTGEIAFTCGMDMLRGKVVVR